MPILFIIFVVVPIIEIALFIQAGDWFGLGPTLFTIVLTAVIGVSLLRQQGLSTLYKAQQKMNHGEIPAMEMIEGIMLAVAGALLITPGFFTDTVGFVLLVPMFRRFLFNTVLRNKIQMHAQTQTSSFNESHINESQINEMPLDSKAHKNRMPPIIPDSPPHLKSFFSCSLLCALVIKYLPGQFFPLLSIRLFLAQ